MSSNVFAGVHGEEISRVGVVGQRQKFAKSASAVTNNSSTSSARRRPASSPSSTNTTRGAKPFQNANVLLGERRAQHGDGIFNPGHPCRDDVGVNPPSPTLRQALRIASRAKSSP